MVFIYRFITQVNNWLQWLAEPDSDEEEDDEEEDEKLMDI